MNYHVLCIGICGAGPLLFLIFSTGEQLPWNDYNPQHTTTTTSNVAADCGGKPDTEADDTGEQQPFLGNKVI